MGQPGAEAGHIGDQDQHDERDCQERQRFLDLGGKGGVGHASRHEQADCHRGRQNAQIQVEHHQQAELDQVDVIGLCQRQQQRDGDDHRRGWRHQHAHDQQEDVDEDQQHELADLHVSNELHDGLRQLQAGQNIRQKAGRADDHAHVGRLLDGAFI